MKSLPFKLFTMDSSQQVPKCNAVYIAIESVIAVLAILGNVLVIWVLKVTPGFQKTIYYFIASLAVADIAVGLTMPAAIVVSLGIPMAYEGCLFMCCLVVAFTQASILSLLAIAIDRYLKVRLLTRYKIITTEKRVWIILVTIWFLSLLVGFVPMFGFAKEKPDNSNYTECRFTKLMKMEYMVYLSFVAGTLVPLILMCILYAKIFCIIRTKMKHCSMNVKGQGIFYRHEFKTAKSLALVLFLSALCWLPLCIMNCITHFVYEGFIPGYVIYMGILLSHSNSVMNPIIYAFRIKKFREACLQILRTYVLHMDPIREAPNVKTSSEAL